MSAALLSWMKCSVFALLALAAAALYLHGDAPLDTANLVGYWVVMPALLGLLLMSFDLAWDFFAGKDKADGEWPKP